MPQVFLSHSAKDKTMVKKVSDYLRKSLLKVWLDEDTMAGGSHLFDEITKGISGSNYFLPFISNHFIQSDWCFAELRNANTANVENKIKLLPVLLEPKKELALSGLAEGKRVMFENLLKTEKYDEIDKNDQEPGIKRIGESIWKNEKVRFKPIEEKTIDNIKLQKIRFETDRKLPTTFLQDWDFDIMEFLAQDEETRDPKPIKHNMPVAFYGRSPNWLLTALTVPLSNKRTIFIYNDPDSQYICAYSLPKDNLYGKVLKEIKT